MSDDETGPIPGAPLPPWRVLSSTTVLDSKWLRVRADRCLTDDGVEISPFYVLDYPDWALVVAIDVDDQLILVQQYRHGIGETSTELPCGGVEKADADPLAAGARELLEETGYAGGDWTYIARLAPNSSTQSNYCHVILAQGVRKLSEPVEDGAEKLRIVRTPVETAIGLALHGGMLQSMHIAALTLALCHVGRWQS